MGNNIARRSRWGVGQVLFPDGRIHVLEQPMVVGELMMEHPQLYVIELEALVSENKAAPLPADHFLDPMKSYAMLPMDQRRRVNITTEEARRLLTRLPLVLATRPVSAPFRFFNCICPSTTEGVALASIQTPNRYTSTLQFSESFQRPEFLSRELSSKGWRPNLDTIMEKVTDEKNLKRRFLKHCRSSNDSRSRRVYQRSFSGSAI